MKHLILITALILTCQILTCQTSYEFSTWLKTETFEYNSGVNFGKVARTKKESLVPWQITAVAVFAVTFEAIGDGLYDKGKADGNQNQMMTGKAFQAIALGSHFLYIPIMKNSNTHWIWVVVVEAGWRFTEFDLIYNAARGVPLGHIGNTTYWDRAMQTFSAPLGMRLFADCIVATFTISITFDKF